MKQVALVLTAASLLAPLARADDVPRFGMFEQSFRQTSACDNPYKELTAAARLCRPDGKQWVMPLFWDGKSAWTLRVSPDAAGKWSYALRSTDPGLNGQSGTFHCVESRLHGSIQAMPGHPLHFQYQDGLRGQ